MQGSGLFSTPFLVIATVLSVFTSLLVASPAPTRPVPTRYPPHRPTSRPPKPPICVVPLPLLYGVEDPFTLVVQNASFPEFDRGTVTFNSLGTANEAYQAVINTGDLLTNATFSGGYLRINPTGAGKGDGELTAQLANPRKTVYQQVLFSKNPYAPLKVVGTYGCIPGTSKQQIELNPVAEEGQDPLGFCVTQEFKGGPFGLFVKKRKEIGKSCFFPVFCRWWVVR